MGIAGYASIPGRTEGMRAGLASGARSEGEAAGSSSLEGPDGILGLPPNPPIPAPGPGSGSEGGTPGGIGGGRMLAGRRGPCPPGAVWER